MLTAGERRRAVTVHFQGWTRVGASASQDEALDAGLTLALVQVWGKQLHGMALGGRGPSNFVPWDLSLPLIQFLYLSGFPTSTDTVSVSSFVPMVTEKSPTCPS